MIHEPYKIYVYNKNKELLAVFDDDGQGLSPEQASNLMVGPRVHIDQNGESTFSFQMMATSEKWKQIKHPENRYYVNGRWYTPLNEGSYQYSGDGNARIVNVTCYETWYLLTTKYKQVYNCGLYVYAKATFVGWSGTGAMFRINSSGCSNPGNTITAANAWAQVKLWQPTDSKGNSLTYNIIKTKGFEPTGWKDCPASVAMTSFSVSGNTATMVVTARAKQEVQQHYDYVANGTYKVESRPYPPSIKEVWVNSTITTDTTSGNKTTRRIVTSNKKANYSYNSSTGQFSVHYTPAKNEEINYVIGVYDFYDMGEISSGATCTFAYGAEVVDEHTFLVLPKADKKYKLTINGVEYDDSQVRDSRGALLPRGSGGYAMWAALYGTGWSLGVCDVIAKGFDASIDYGCFNVESDMKDTLYNIQMVQELYGGILDFDSDKQILNYRAENSEDYDSYNDGFNDWTGYEFREGKNITDQPSIVVDNNLITKGYILGYGNLNIKNVNGGKSYVTDYSYTTDTYEGYLEQPLIYDTNDEGGQRQLLYWGQKEIKKKSRPRETITYHCTDIRTAQGYEHEVFNINDVCRAYYRDTETGEEVFELKRVISWEYNVFALWDCTVELGDKTSNLSEVFRLIYNMAVNEAPKTNATGKISSDEIVMEIDMTELDWSISDFDYDDYEYPNTPIGDYTGGGGYGGGGSIYNNTLTDYISLIARKTTNNSDAISGLIIEANELYAQSELFASYQKRTDDLISDTYSGLRVYADEKSSELEAVVKGNYTQLQNGLNGLQVDINGVKADVTRVETISNAGFQAVQSLQGSVAQQFARYDQTIYTMQGSIQTNAQAIVRTEANAQHANAIMQANFDTLTRDVNGKITNVTQAQAKFEAEANAKYATTQQLSKYSTIDYVTGAISKSEASVKTYADKTFAKASLTATVNNLSSAVAASTAGTYLYAGTGGSRASYLSLVGNVLSLSTGSNGLIQLNSSRVNIKGRAVSWTPIRTAVNNNYYVLTG